MRSQRHCPRGEPCRIEEEQQVLTPLLRDLILGPVWQNDAALEDFRRLSRIFVLAPTARCVLLHLEADRLDEEQALVARHYLIGGALGPFGLLGTIRG